MKAELVKCAASTISRQVEERRRSAKVGIITQVLLILL